MCIWCFNTSVKNRTDFPNNPIIIDLLFSNVSQTFDLTKKDPPHHPSRGRSRDLSIERSEKHAQKRLYSRLYGRPSSGVERSVFSEPGVALASRSSSSGVAPRFGTEPVPPVPVGERLAEPAGLCGPPTSWPAAATAAAAAAAAPETDTTAPPPAPGSDVGENIFDMLESEPMLGRPPFPGTAPFPVSTLRHLLGGANADGTSGRKPPKGSL